MRALLHLFVFPWRDCICELNPHCNKMPINSPTAVLPQQCSTRPLFPAAMVAGRALSAQTPDVDLSQYSAISMSQMARAERKSQGVGGGHQAPGLPTSLHMSQMSHLSCATARDFPANGAIPATMLSAALLVCRHQKPSVISGRGCACPGVYASSGFDVISFACSKRDQMLAHTAWIPRGGVTV